MPYIDCKFSKQLSEEQKTRIKTALGQSVSIIHKPESYLMVGIQDGYSLYFAGKGLDNGAYVSVSLFGSAKPSDYDKMTEKICGIFKDVLDISGKDVYVTYHGVGDWGWNGSNF